MVKYLPRSSGRMNSWPTIKEAILTMALRAVRDLKTTDASALVRELEVDLLSSITSFRTKASAKRHAKGTVFDGVDFESVQQACRLFGIPTPVLGRRVDPNAAKSVMRARARAYHPDVTGGNPATTLAYKETMTSYRTIVKYNESLEAK